MQFSGQILKMTTQNGKPIQYFLNLSDDLINMNQLIGENLKLKHIGYQCVNCGRDEENLPNGILQKMFFESPYASETIIRLNFLPLISALKNGIWRLKNPFSCSRTWCIWRIPAT